MTIEILTTNQDFQRIKSKWEALEQKDSQCSYYSTYSFLEQWWSIYGPASNLELFILCAFQGDTLIGAAPLCIEQKKKGPFSFRELRFMGKGDYFGFIIDPEESSPTVIKHMMKVIEEDLDHFDRIHLQYISQHQALAEFFFRQPQYNKDFLPLVEIPEVHLQHYDTFEEFERTIPQKTRKYRNKLQKEVGYTFHVQNRIDEPLFQRMTQLHTRQQQYLQLKKGRSERRLMFEESKRYEFYKNILCRSEKAYAFYLLSSEGTLLTYNLAFFHNKRLLSWNSAYDPDFEQYRLAKIRYYEIFRYLFETPLAEIFDFGAGRYPWKFEWTRNFSMVYELSVWRKNHQFSQVLGMFEKARKVFK